VIAACGPSPVTTAGDAEQLLNHTSRGDPGCLGCSPKLSWEGITLWRIHTAHALKPCTV